MSESARLRVRQLMEAVTAGNAEALEGRGVNSSYRISDGGRLLSVKVHCPDRSSDLEFQRIRTVDTALRGAPWYPPVLDMGFHSAEHPQLVVIRPFMPGAPSDNAREHIDRLVAVIRDFTTSASGIELAGELVGDFASPWVSHGDRELSQLGPILVGPWEGLARTVDERLPALVGSAVRLTRSHVPVVYHGDLHGRAIQPSSAHPAPARPATIQLAPAPGADRGTQDAWELRSRLTEFQLPGACLRAAILPDGVSELFTNEGAAGV